MTMNKILTGLVLGCIVLASCKKDHSKDNNPTAKLQKVTFRLGLVKSTGAFQTNSLHVNSTTPDTSVTNYMDVLYYMVFDAQGNSLHNITQSASDTAFGHYTDNLAPGTYTVAIAGGKSGLVIKPGNLSHQYIYYQAITWEFNYPVPVPFDKDAFFYRGTLTVGSTAATQNISLSRIVSKLVVNINDAIPNNATKAGVGLNYNANTYLVGDGSTGEYIVDAILGFGEYRGYTFDVKSTDWGKTNYQMSTLFLPPSSPIPVTIYVSTPTTILGQKVLSNVTGQPNKVTLLSGNLFGGSGGGGFQVAVDTAWNTPVVKTFP